MLSYRRLFLSLFPIHQCIASPAQLKHRAPGASPPLGGASGGPSSTTSLVVTDPAHPSHIVTFYPSRVSSQVLWNITTITVISSTETVYPSGYEWVPSPFPDFPPPAIPKNAPCPTPGSVSISVPRRSLETASAVTSSAGQGISSNGKQLAPPTALVSLVSSSKGNLGNASNSALGSGNSSSSLSGPNASGLIHRPSASVSNSTAAINRESRSTSPSAATTFTGSLPSANISSRSASGAASASGLSANAPSSRSAGGNPSNSAPSNRKTGAPLNSASTVTSKPSVSGSSSTASGPSQFGPSLSGPSPTASVSGTPSILANSSPSHSAVSAGSEQFSVTPTESPQSFIFPDQLSSTVSNAAATSHASVVGELFLALHSNREWIRDPMHKQEYIDDVKRTRDDTFALFNNLDVKPPAPPECSNTKTKRDLTLERRRHLTLSRRSLLSGVLNTLKDVASLISCATQVVDSLVDSVKAPDPPIPDIENLTDDLKDIADKLQEDEDEPSKSASKNKPSKTSGIDEPKSWTSSALASTTSLVSSSSFTGEAYCRPSCSACANDAIPQGSGVPDRKSKRNGLLDRRTLADPAAFDIPDQQFQDQVIGPTRDGEGARMQTPFAVELSSGLLASANNVAIYISSPKDPRTGKFLYQNRVDKLKDLLVGNDSPYRGITPTERGYVKPPPGALEDDWEATKLGKSPRGKVLIEYDNNQIDEDNPSDGTQTAIYRIWLETQYYTHTWVARDTQKGLCAAPTGDNHKRDVASASGRACSRPMSSGGKSGTASSGSGANTASSVKASGTIMVASTTKAINTGPITSGPTAPRSSSTLAGKPFSNRCSPFQDPDAGITQDLCQCDGLDGKYPALPSPPTSTDYFNRCGFTTPPTVSPTSVLPFTTTESDGEVLRCETSAYYNYIVNQNPTCAGSSTVISTVASIKSAYESSRSASIASASSSSAEASWSSAAAVPSAGCWILDDDGFGDSVFAVYGINGWAGDEGDKLHDQEDGCGILSGWEWRTGLQEEFGGRRRDTQSAVFGLSFFKGGCVERAVHSAGGPSPGDRDGELACQHYGGQDKAILKSKANAKSAQVKAVADVANSGDPQPGTKNRLETQEKVVVANEPDGATPTRTQRYGADIIASAKAALPHLQTAVDGAA
ncbi:MAG: hypothetical protein Q9225_000952 [Loekoesia sp. 1 TL-2023]